VQGGRASRRSNPFVLDCRAAFAMRADFRAPAALAVGRQRVSIVSDGTCGSTCASFAKIAQEAGVATMVGLGGVWHQPMDVASFAGGFVCNARYLQVMANLRCARIE
jgi:hypothetical protein